MDTTNTLEVGTIAIGLFGGLALFLFGMEQMTDAMKSVAGAGMKSLLTRLTTNRFKAVFTGAFVTAVIQSSSVTTVLVVGFVTAGLLTLSQGIAITLGAVIGTTITAQIVALKVTQYALLLVGIGFVKFPRTYLVGEEKTRETKALSGGTTEQVKLSELDRKIIALLLKNGRMEFARIARTLGVSTGLIHKHYYRMVEKGVITKITYTPNYRTLGLTHYRILVKILRYDQGRVDELYHYCAQHPHIVNYIKLMGNWELMLEVEIDNNAALRELLRDVKYKFKDIITNIQKNEVYHVDKFTQMADEFPALHSHGS